MNREKVTALKDCISEELAARGWDLDRLAVEMGRYDIGVNRLTLDMIMKCGDDAGLLLGEAAATRLGHAFGVSAEFFLNLDKARRDELRFQGRPGKGVQ